MRYNIEIKAGSEDYNKYLESLGYKQMLNILISRIDRDEKRMLKINTKSKIVITGAEPGKLVYFFIDERHCFVKFILTTPLINFMSLLYHNCKYLSTTNLNILL